MGKHNYFVDNHKRNEAYVWLSFWGSVISLFASLITIILIVKLKSNTGHIYLVYLMSIYQLIQDASYFFSNVDFGYYVTAVADTCQVFSSTSVALTSNWIAFISMYILCYRRTFDIFGNINWIHTSVLAISLLCGLLFFFSKIPESYKSNQLTNVAIVYLFNNIRIASISLNFLFAFVAIERIFRSRNTKTPQAIAIRTLTFRMIYYPLLQAICRSGYSWYVFAYGPKTDNDDFGETQYVAQMFAAGITSIASIGYLLIFLIMQPNAYRQFKLLFSCRSSATDVNDDEKEDDASPRIGERESFANTTTNRKSDAVMEFSASESGNSPPTFTDLDNNRHSFTDWVRKSFTGIDMRYEDELYAAINDSSESSRPLSSPSDSSVNDNQHIFVTDNILHHSAIRTSLANDQL